MFNYFSSFSQFNGTHASMLLITFRNFIKSTFRISEYFKVDWNAQNLQHRYKDPQIPLKAAIVVFTVFQDTDVDVDGQAETGMVFGVRVIRKEGAEVHERPEEVLIVLEGVEVLTQLGNVPVACAMLFALVYALNLRYPAERKYTFEALQKLIMGLDGQRLSKKLQVLKTLLAR